jgi:hypothetical protein
MVSGVRLKSVNENLLLNGEGEYGGASSALLYYQNNKNTKIAWQFMYSDRTCLVQMTAECKVCIWLMIDVVDDTR